MKKTVLFLLAAVCLMTFPAVAHAQGPVQIFHYQSAPTGPCSADQVAKNDLTGDFYVCGPSGWLKVNGAGGSGGACSGANCFLVASFPGYRSGSGQVVDATWAGSGSNVVTFPNSDGPVAADAGKLCWGMPSASTTAGPTTPGVLAITTPKTAATCTAADLISSATANGIFTWGYDNTAPVVAAAAAQATQPKCGTIIWPSEILMINQGFSYTGTTASDCGLSYIGFGYSSHIVLEPGFSFSAVTNGVGCTSLGCFGNTAASTVWQNFQIDGTNQSLSGISTAPASALFTIGPGSYAIGVNMFGWATAASNGPKGANINGAGPFGLGFAISNWGDGNIWGSGQISIGNNNGGTNVTLKTVGFTDDYAGTYSGVYVTQGSELHAWGTTANANNGGFGAMSCDRGSLGTHLDGAKVGLGTPGANGIGFQFNNNGTGGNCVAYAKGTTFNGGGSGAAISVPSGATGDLWDQGGNTFSSPFLSNSGTFRYHHRETGTCVFAAATTCTVTFAFTFGNSTLPTFPISPINPGAVTFTVTALSTTAATITASASNSLSVGWEAVLQ
jgi:hypothetical protein